MTNFQIPILMKEPLPRRRDCLLRAVIFFGALALYWRTLAPSVATIFDDSLEFQLVCPTLGIAHPTGYPLYTLLGKFFTLIPIGDAAYRVNLMSAFFAALTVVFTYLIVHVLTDDSPSALFASLAIAVSPVFWSQAVIAEVYSLNAFFTALVVYLLLRWEANRRQRPTASMSGAAAPNNLLLAAFVYGLSLTHHRLMLLLAPAMALFAWLTERRIFTNLKLVLRLILLFLAPLLLYAYIPLRGLHTSSLDGIYQNTWSGFLRHVTASGYNVFITGSPETPWLKAVP
jgi:4-amino-4-deoxy-L-arabinose transferase-like glycosyltransferase